MNIKSHLLVILLFLSLSLSAQNLVQFRGPARDGVYHETNLLQVWPENGPALLWKSDSIGNGYSSPVVTEDKIFVTGEIDSIGYIFAYDKSGKELWRKETGPDWMENFTGSRSTPTLVDGLLYIETSMGRLLCMDAENGKVKWSIEMMKDLHGINVRFGYSEGPLINDNLIYCTPGGPDTNVVALDRFTGKIIWVSKALGDSTSYASPLLVKLPARDIIVNFTIHNFIALDAMTGELLWHRKLQGDGDIQANTALFSDGFLYYMTSGGNGMTKLKLSDDGRIATEVWTNPKVNDVHGGFVKFGNYIYTSQYKPKRYCSLDCGSGLVADSLKFDKGAIILADGLLYCYTEKGMVGLVKPDEGKMELLSSFKMPLGTKEYFTIPVISGGILYLRHGPDMLAYDIRKK